VIKGWDEGIIGGDGVPPMLAGTFFIGVNSFFFDRPR